jgi:hypothetical protein
MGGGVLEEPRLQAVAIAPVDTGGDVVERLIEVVVRSETYDQESALHDWGRGEESEERLEVATELLRAFAPGVPGIEDRTAGDIDPVPGNVCDALFRHVVDVEVARGGLVEPVVMAEVVPELYEGRSAVGCALASELCAETSEHLVLGKTQGEDCSANGAVSVVLFLWVGVAADEVKTGGMAAFRQQEERV